MESLQPVALFALIVGCVLIVIGQEKAITAWPVGGTEWIPTTGYILAVGGFIGLGILLA
jgi:hypothetical protein